MIVTGALVLAVTAGSAASPVKATMKAWKADANLALTMVNGASEYSEEQMRRILETFLSDAQSIEARITKPSGAGIKHRFAQFEADVEAAKTAIGKKPQAKAALSQVLSDCKACHDVYAN